MNISPKPQALTGSGGSNMHGAWLCVGGPPFRGSGPDLGFWGLLIKV